MSKSSSKVSLPTSTHGTSHVSPPPGKRGNKRRRKDELSPSTRADPPPSSCPRRETSAPLSAAPPRKKKVKPATSKRFPLAIPTYNDIARLHATSSYTALTQGRSQSFASGTPHLRPKDGRSPPSGVPPVIVSSPGASQVQGGSSFFPSSSSPQADSPLSTTNGKHHRQRHEKSGKQKTIHDTRFELFEICRSLSWEQKEALEAVEEGENVVVLGEAGSGKTFLINAIRRLSCSSHLATAAHFNQGGGIPQRSDPSRSIEGKKEGLNSIEQFSEILITALTGAAASRIGAMTLHGALGMHVGVLERLEKLHRETACNFEDITEARVNQMHEDEQNGLWSLVDGGILGDKGDTVEVPDVPREMLQLLQYQWDSPVARNALSLAEKVVHGEIVPDGHKEAFIRTMGHFYCVEDLCSVSPDLFSGKKRKSLFCEHEGHGAHEKKKFGSSQEEKEEKRSADPAKRLVMFPSVPCARANADGDPPTRLWRMRGDLPFSLVFPPLDLMFVKSIRTDHVKRLMRFFHSYWHPSSLLPFADPSLPSVFVSPRARCQTQKSLHPSVVGRAVITCSLKMDKEKDAIFPRVQDEMHRTGLWNASRFDREVDDLHRPTSPGGAVVTPCYTPSMEVFLENLAISPEGKKWRDHSPPLGTETEKKEKEVIEDLSDLPTDEDEKTWERLYREHPFLSYDTHGVFQNRPTRSALSIYERTSAIPPVPPSTAAVAAAASSPLPAAPASWDHEESPTLVFRPKLFLRHNARELVPFCPEMPVRGHKLAHSPLFGQLLELAESHLQNMSRSKQGAKRIWGWQKLKLLVVDEAFMMTSTLLMFLDVFLRLVRRCMWAPFGGLQLFFLGDTSQLPPVGETLPVLFHRAFRRAFLPPIGRMFRFSQQHRQKEDPAFASLLRFIRAWDVTNQEGFERLALTLLEHTNIGVGSKSLTLCPTNEDVRKWTEAFLSHHYPVTFEFLHSPNVIRPAHVTEFPTVEEAWSLCTLQRPEQARALGWNGKYIRFTGNPDLDVKFITVPSAFRVIYGTWFRRDSAMWKTRVIEVARQHTLYEALANREKASSRLLGPSAVGAILTLRANQNLPMGVVNGTTVEVVGLLFSAQQTFRVRNDPRWKRVSLPVSSGPRLQRMMNDYFVTSLDCNQEEAAWKGEEMRKKGVFDSLAPSCYLPAKTDGRTHFQFSVDDLFALVVVHMDSEGNAVAGPSIRKRTDTGAGGREEGGDASDQSLYSLYFPSKEELKVPLPFSLPDGGPSVDLVGTVSVFLLRAFTSFASTIHLQQGSTLRFPQMNLPVLPVRASTSVMNVPQLYVALSRMQRLEQLVLTPLSCLTVFHTEKTALVLRCLEAAGSVLKYRLDAKRFAVARAKHDWVDPSVELPEHLREAEASTKVLVEQILLLVQPKSEDKETVRRKLQLQEIDYMHDTYTFGGCYRSQTPSSFVPMQVPSAAGSSFGPSMRARLQNAYETFAVPPLSQIVRSRAMLRYKELEGKNKGKYASFENLGRGRVYDLFPFDSLLEDTREQCILFLLKYKSTKVTLSFMQEVLDFHRAQKKQAERNWLADSRTAKLSSVAFVNALDVVLLKYGYMDEQTGEVGKRVKDLIREVEEDRHVHTQEVPEGGGLGQRQHHRTKEGGDPASLEKVQKDNLETCQKSGVWKTFQKKLSEERRCFVQRSKK